MDVSVIGKHVDVGEALKTHVEEHLETNVRKYFDQALDALVTFSREGRNFRADISVHPGRGMVVQGRADAADAYAAFDSALERIAKQLRRYKRRLRDHHKGHGEETLPAQQYVLAAENDDEEASEEGNPVIVAELATEIATLTVGEAVMRMDLADSPVVMFRNRAHGGLNVIYRRADGNVGWIDPTNVQQG